MRLIFLDALLKQPDSFFDPEPALTRQFSAPPKRGAFLQQRTQRTSDRQNISEKRNSPVTASRFRHDGSL